MLPIVYRAVEFAPRSSWVFDPAPGGDRDGQAEAGERVLPRIRLRNVGVEPGSNVTVRLTTSDVDVTVAVGEVHHGSWPAGEARNNYGFVVDIARLAGPHDVEFTVTVGADGGVRRRFPYTLRIAAPAVRLVDMDLRLYDGAAGDGVADPGETLWPRLTLAHIGTEVATNLRATLLSLDDEIIVVRPEALLSTLPGGTWEIVELRLRVTSDAIPFQASAVIDITADNGGPWRFTVPLPVSNVSGMQVRTAWAVDHEPGGNGDRRINPGESITVHLRVANDGLGVHTNVQTTLVVDDPDIVVTSAVDPVESWSPQSSHNRTVSFTADVAPDAQPHDVDVVVEITADDSDPRRHTLVIPIINRPPKFARRSVWVWDPSASANGNGDGAANPGERVFPRIRLRNIGQSPATNVRASLVILDPDVEVVAGLVTHDTWPAGAGRSNNGFVLDIASDATSHDVEAVLSVTADDVGPWRFAVTIPIVAPEVVATALLANYPNPFNPETWIPFDLSQAAEVTVSVYDARGVVVRRLDLGRLAAGPYRTRSTAAYWDGRNDVGERVSSGMYMYELRAGASRQMRRMIVRK